MRHRFHSFLIVLLSLAGCEGIDDVGTISQAETPIETSRCSIAGSGELDNGDLVDGVARGELNGITGEWLHEVTDGTIVLGAPDFVFCSINGNRIGNTTGPATLNGQPGFEFAVRVHDHSSPTSPLRSGLGAEETQTITATREYCPTSWQDGALAIDGTALVTIPDTLDVIVGNAGNHWATFDLDTADGDRVVCRYRGGSGTGYPDTAEEIAGGTHYDFVRCTGDDHGEIVAGDQVEVSSMVLRVQSGAHHFPSAEDAQTTVSVDVTIQEIVTYPRVLDDYSITITHPATRQVVFSVSGLVTDGDLAVDLL